MLVRFIIIKLKAVNTCINTQNIAAASFMNVNLSKCNLHRVGTCVSYVIGVSSINKGYYLELEWSVNSMFVFSDKALYLHWLSPYSCN